MKALLYATAMCLATLPALANPIQTNSNGNPAQAQVYGTGSASAAHAFGGNGYGYGGSGTAYGGAGGHSSAHQHQTVNVYGNGSDGSSGGSYGYDGPRLVPTPYAPTIISGPCGRNTSAGVTTGFFGLSFGNNTMDVVCQLHTIGQNEAAKQYLCIERSDVRKAFEEIGQPCADDPVRQIKERVPTGGLDHRVYKYDWCYTASPGELKQHKECLYSADRQPRR